MKIKLDENIHRDVAAALVAQHHDVVTVPDQGLAGHPHADLARAVQAEARCLVTFDLDFSDTRRYPPAQYAGIVVLRLGASTARNQIACLTRFFARTEDVIGRLWILEDTRDRDWTPGVVSEHVGSQYQAANP